MSRTAKKKSCSSCWQLRPITSAASNTQSPVPSAVTLTQAQNPPVNTVPPPFHKIHLSPVPIQPPGHPSRGFDSKLLTHLQHCKRTKNSCYLHLSVTSVHTSCCSCVIPISKTRFCVTSTTHNMTLKHTQIELLTCLSKIMESIPGSCILALPYCCAQDGEATRLYLCASDAMRPRTHSLQNECPRDSMRMIDSSGSVSKHTPQSNTRCWFCSSKICMHRSQQVILFIKLGKRQLFVTMKGHFPIQSPLVWFLFPIGSLPVHRIRRKVPVTAKLSSCSSPSIVLLSSLYSRRHP